MAASAIAETMTLDQSRDRFAWTAELPGHLQRQIWRGDALGSASRGSLPSGHAALDRELPGGGWPRAALTELLLAQPGAGELRLLAPVLADLTARAGRHVLLIAPPCLPYAPAWMAWGVALDRLIWIAASRREERDAAKQQGADVLWAAEQSLKHQGMGAILVWHATVRAEALRRLQLAAQDGDALAFLMRPAHTAAQSSPAPLRILCEARGGADLQHSGLDLTIIKRRGPVLENPVHVPLPLEAERLLATGGGHMAHAGIGQKMEIVQQAGVELQTDVAQQAGVGEDGRIGKEVEDGHAMDRCRSAVVAA
ncbi:translesion DNA synthesis-associated protein ImuA [Mycetohabitans sp. B8]|uniref:translesion DNA synthesis-associated protein ImuA n=1 Tax=Mycetohabitans sp. B8 TaxID=2841845 RepID=UPI001F01C14B|nr:translesion DNA synthesis-associated protein ImuA [Mycetohabitans sp. B8]MCG1042142.1 translesion DNA synthesis-associated protein ImuA [Mycetohabitans sp. B8]